MYRVVNAAVIFEVLWSLLSFGHRELVGAENAADIQPKVSLFPDETVLSTLSPTSSVFDWHVSFWTLVACALLRAHCVASLTNTSSFFR